MKTNEENEEMNRVCQQLNEFWCEHYQFSYVEQEEDVIVYRDGIWISTVSVYADSIEAAKRDIYRGIFKEVTK